MQRALWRVLVPLTVCEVVRCALVSGVGPGYMDGRCGHDGFASAGDDVGRRRHMHGDVAISVVRL